MASPCFKHLGEHSSVEQEDSLPLPGQSFEQPSKHALLTDCQLSHSPREDRMPSASRSYRALPETHPLTQINDLPSAMSIHQHSCRISDSLADIVMSLVSAEIWMTSRGKLPMPCRSLCSATSQDRNRPRELLRSLPRKKDLWKCMAPELWASIETATGKFEV